MPKNILVIGSGGREHAICEALQKSSQKVQIFNFAEFKNIGIKNIAQEIHIGDIFDFDAVTTFAKKIGIDFAITGPDDPIGAGVTDALAKIGVKSFAPTKKCAQLESSKSFTRNLLKKYGIDASPQFFISENISDIKTRAAFFKKLNGQIVVKADGLCGGKGVLVAGDHFTEFKDAENFAQNAIQKFGKVVLEEKLIGEEFSLIFLSDGKTILETPAVQDHKRAFTDDHGPQTGGMGTISDENNSLPFLNKLDLQTAREITKKTLLAINKEMNEKFIGVMYGGFMKTQNGIKLIEYNTRFGDPEVLNILPILENDFVDICERAIAGKLNEIKLQFQKKATVVKYLCPLGYPEDPIKTGEIKINSSIQKIENGRGKVFFASAEEKNGKIIMKGSRAVGVVGIGDDLATANENCEEMISQFSGEFFYRGDIGTEKLMQKRIKNIKNLTHKL